MSDIDNGDESTVRQPPKRHTQLLVGGGIVVGLVALVALYAGLSSNESDADRATTTVEPTPEAQPTQIPTPEVEAPKIPTFTVEQYKTPAAAAEALEKFRMQFIAGDLPYSYADFSKADSTLTYDQYVEMNVAAILGENRTQDNEDKLLELQDYWDAVNGEIRNSYGDDVYYRMDLVDMGIQSIKGNTVVYRPVYALDRNGVPDDFRDPNIEKVGTDADETGTITVTLEQETPGIWDIAEAHTDYDK